MPMKTDPFGMMQRATKKAFASIKQTSNVEADPDLSLYNTLKAEDFTDLMKEYGEQPILDYIKAMEGKRLGAKGGDRDNA